MDLVKRYITPGLLSVGTGYRVAVSRKWQSDRLRHSATALLLFQAPDMPALCSWWCVQTPYHETLKREGKGRNSSRGYFFSSFLRFAFPRSNRSN